MKKFHILIPAFLLIFNSCSETKFAEDEQITASDESSVSMNNRSMADAIQLADAVINNPEARSGHKQVGNVDVITGRSARSNQDTLLYVVNYEDNGGFVLVSAPKSVEPLLGFSFDGNMNYDTEKNENFLFVRELTEYYIRVNSANDSHSRGAGSTQDGTQTIKMHHCIDPRIPVEWGQLWPGNIYFENYIAGCGNIALAQICCYFRTPTTMSLDFPKKDQNQVTLDWDRIIQHKHSANMYTPVSQVLVNHMAECPADMETHKNIGRYVRQIACYTNSQIVTGIGSYGSGGTSTNEDGIISGIRILFSGYNYSKNINIYDLFNDLSNDGCVAIMFGLDNVNSKASHIWIADGNYIVSITYNTYKNGVLVSSVGSSTKYIHHNWGFNGENNGYFIEDVINPEAMKITPQPNDSGFTIVPNPLSRTPFAESIYSSVYYIKIKK